MMNHRSIQLEVGLYPSIYRDTHSKVLGGMHISPRSAMFTNRHPETALGHKRLVCMLRLPMRGAAVLEMC